MGTLQTAKFDRVTFLIRAAAFLGVPARLQRLVGWALAVIVLVALLWGAKAAYDASVIDHHQAKQEKKTVKALDVAAEQRATDAIVNAMAERDRENAIAAAEAAEAAKPPAERATLPPTTLALNCARFKRAYSPAELAKIPAYKELCK